jgi:hypothetical protein
MRQPGNDLTLLLLAKRRMYFLPDDKRTQTNVDG